MTQTFYKSLANYFYYDFTNIPTGNVASLKIIDENKIGITVSKVICIFVKERMEDKDMLTEINNAAQKGINFCKGNEKKDPSGYNALINANDINNNKKRILIMIQYGFGDNEDNKESNGFLKDDAINMRINLRINGFDINESDKQYNENEDNALMPYVLDLYKIRNSESDFISNILIYSMTRELEIYHLQSNTPTHLLTGNILFIYTNPEIIKEKYQGATKIILLTESLFKNKMVVIGENYRFITYFFKSDNTIQYFESINPSGRPINIPINMQMPYCNKSYYYILNYYYPEDKELTLHIDEIYGEIKTKKIATSLDKSWYDLINNMDEFKLNDILLKKNSKYYIDIFEAKCNLPSLLNIYYTDDNNPEIKGIHLGDTSIINLSPNESINIQLQLDIIESFTKIFTFEILSENREPNITINFAQNEELIKVTKKGIYIKRIRKAIDYDKICIKNEVLIGFSKTRIIFKYGYEIEDTFDKIDNQLYHYNKTSNLYGYKFKTEDDWLNYTGISFLISTPEENAKFCYSTSFGAYMEPSLQDCYIIGKYNPYTLNILNPYLMYNNYIIEEDEIIKYYVGFKTVKREQEIKITPIYNKYEAKIRNFEDTPINVIIAQNNNVILTAPKENKYYIFLQMQVCDKDKKIVDLDFFDAYNNISLGS